MPTLLVVDDEPGVCYSFTRLFGDLLEYSYVSKIEVYSGEKVVYVGELLDGDLATAEPKKLRYRLLHVAARITRTGRRTWVRVADNWPWATDLVAGFTRLTALPRPVT